MTQLATGRAAAKALTFLIVLALELPRAHAADSTVVVTADAIGRAGPAGVVLVVGAAHRWVELDGLSPLERVRYVELHASAAVSPAQGEGSIGAEWVPIAPLQLRLDYTAFGYFGANGSRVSFPSPEARFGQSELDALSGREEKGFGHRVRVSPVLRARVGKLVIRNQFDVDWYRMSGTPGWYYEAENDTLLSQSGFLLLDRAAVLYEWPAAGKSSLLLGPTYEVTHAFDTRLTRQRVGAAVFFSFGPTWLGLENARLFALGGVNMQDRNRDGKPFAVFGFGGDLLLKKTTP